MGRIVMKCAEGLGIVGTYQLTSGIPLMQKKENQENTLDDAICVSNGKVQVILQFFFRTTVCVRHEN